MSFLSQNKRPFIALLFAFSFLVTGIFIITMGLINTGGLFFYSPIPILAYVPIYWFIISRKTSEKLQLWKRRELWIFTLWILVVHSIGLIESIVYGKISILIFSIAILTLVFFINKYLRLRNSNIIITVDYKIKIAWLFSVIFFTGISFFIYAVSTEITEKGDLVLLENDEELIETLLSILVVVIFFFILSWWIWQVLSAIRLKNEKKKTEVLHLQSQVNPHFFFNTLNNLYGLVAEDTNKAQAMILQLSDMMRYSIYDGQADRVTIMQEITYLKNYIALHKMRYHKEIDIQFTTAIQDKEVRVMPLLFILLVENAFKHGVEALHTDAYVAIHIQNTTTETLFSIENRYDAIQTAETSGIGLKNLKRRLALVYPKKHTLSFDIIDDLYKVQLILKTK